MFCPNCGTQLSDDVKYCSNCGFRFENKNEQDNHSNANTTYIVSSNIDSLLQRSKEYLDAGQDLLASELLHRVLNIDANHLLAKERLEFITNKLFDKAEKLVSEGYIEAAIKLYRQAVMITPWLAEKIKDKINVLEERKFIEIETKELFGAKTRMAVCYKKLLISRGKEFEEKQFIDFNDIDEIKFNTIRRLKLSYFTDSRHTDMKVEKFDFDSDDVTKMEKVFNDAKGGIYIQHSEAKNKEPGCAETGCGCLVLILIVAALFNSCGSDKKAEPTKTAASTAVEQKVETKKEEVKKSESVKPSGYISLSGHMYPGVWVYQIDTETNECVKFGRIVEINHDNNLILMKRPVSKTLEVFRRENLRADDSLYIREDDPYYPYGTRKTNSK